MEITGKVLTITDKITVGQKNTEKQSILVKEQEHEEDYKNNSLMIDFFSDSIKKIQSLTTGDIVTVKFNTSTREYKDKNGENRVFNSITGYSVELVWAGSVEDTSDSLPFN